MSKIDWTKPIETTGGIPATLLQVLDTNSSHKYVVVWRDDSNKYNEMITRADEEGNTLMLATPCFRNVAEPLRLYGALGRSGRAWTTYATALDTHVIELMPDDMQRLVKPLSKAEKQ